MRIDINRTSIVASDPFTGQRVSIAEDLDDQRWSAAQQQGWKQLNEIRRKFGANATVSDVRAKELISRVYAAGVTTLLTLMGPNDWELRLEEVRAFFAARFQELVSEDSPPPVLDVVNHTGWHLAVEMLPLFGSGPKRTGADVLKLREFARVFPGFAAAIRRPYLPNKANRYPKSRPLRTRGASVYVFRHSRLPGVNSEINALKELSGKGLSIARTFPERNGVTTRRSPEETVAAIVGGTEQSNERDDRRSDRVCHFACHLRSGSAGQGRYLEMKPPGRFSAKSKYFLTLLQAARADLPRGESPALVFLNTCRSGIADPDLLISATHVFEYFKPRCLIGTIADVPDAAASVFAKEFYGALFSGSDVAAALRAARLKLLLGGDNNPFGLLFTSYFGEDFYPLLPSDQLSRFIPA